MSTKTLKSPIRGFIGLVSLMALLVLVNGCEYFLPNKPPFAEKLLPADSAVYIAGQQVDISVKAYDVDGTLIHVVFTPPNSPAYTDDTAPYEFSWQTAGLAAGYYNVEIKAVDDQDEPYIISAPVRILGALSAYAGKDTTFTDSRTTFILEAERPIYGQGTWSIISGTGGLITDLNNPHATFTGYACSTYTLRWTVSNGISESSDDVVITFSYLPGTANAGPDQSFTDGRSIANLSATAPTDGAGIWKVVSGDGGYFNNATLPDAIFNGLSCKNYILSWTVSTQCAQSTDLVEISFGQPVKMADAGPDIRISDGTLFTLLKGNDPGTRAIGKWTILTGVGGVVDQPGNPVSRFTGLAGQVYTLEWQLSNFCSNSADMVNVSFIANLDFVDARDGRNYRAVRIGNQVWMAENLNFLAAGSLVYNDNSANATQYGRLYDWNTASGACPDGWHLPSDAEWRGLETTLGMDNATTLLEWYRGYNEGGMLKEEGISNWSFPNAGASDITGFTARPGGYRTPAGLYGGMAIFAGFWSTTSNSGGKAITRTLANDQIQIGRDYYEKGYAFSVRCIKE